MSHNCSNAGSSTAHACAGARSTPAVSAVLKHAYRLLVHEGSPSFTTALQEGQYEREGYGQRPYDNWETIMFDCEKQVGWEGRSAGTMAVGAGTQRPGARRVTVGHATLQQVDSSALGFPVWSLYL